MWAAGLIVQGSYAYSVAVGRPTHGFIAYYAAAHALVTGAFGSWVYDEPSFTAYVHQLTGTGVIEIFGPNPPSMALLMVPLAALTPSIARAVWLALSLAGLGWASAALARRVSPRGLDAGTVALALMMFSPPVFANLRNAQAYLLLAAAQCAAVLFILRQRDGAAGALLGAGLALKTSGAPMLMVIGFARRPRVLVTALAAGVVCAALTIAASGIEPWTRYPAYVWDFVSQPRAAVTPYQTTTSLFRRLCVADPRWNPAPAADCAGLAWTIPVLLEAGAVLVTLGAARSAPTVLWFAAGACLSLLALPIAEDHQFALLAVPMMLLVASRPRSDHDPVFGWAFGAFSLLLMAPLDYTAHRFVSGWAVLLAYPRLYAAWCLWALVIREIRRRASGANSLNPLRETRAHASP